MEYSSGVILYREREDGEIEFFLCTPGGPYWEHKELWNFPKGHIEEGETPFVAAVREFTEETNIDITKDETKYEYLGSVQQNKTKIVHVFSKLYDGEDTSNCKSNETYSYFYGLKVIHGEIKAYKWMTLSEIKKKGMRCYIHTFIQIIENYRYDKSIGEC